MSIVDYEKCEFDFWQTAQCNIWWCLALMVITALTHRFLGIVTSIEEPILQLMGLVLAMSFFFIGIRYLAGSPEVCFRKIKRMPNEK